MLLIFGTRAYESIFNVVMFICGYCGTEASQSVIKRSNRFTLFFIPLFSFSTKYINVCSHCGGETALTADQARNSLTWSGRARQ